VNRTGLRVEQADKALAEPFKHADALKAAQTDSARIDQLMPDAAKPEELAQPEPPAEVDPRMEDVLYPLRVGPSSSRPLRAGRVPLVVMDHTPTPRCAPRTRARHSLEKTAGYDAARTARLKRLLDGGLRQRSAHLGSELLELLACLAKRVPMDFMSATQEWVIKRGGAF
jgi:hypothetical protein